MSEETATEKAEKNVEKPHKGRYTNVEQVCLPEERGVQRGPCHTLKSPMENYNRW
jgi:hypothetical protein